MPGPIGNRNAWKGLDAGYTAKHKRVYKARGRADSCVFGHVSDRYDWANLTGNYDDINDFAPMCKVCHQRYGDAFLSMLPATRKLRLAKLTPEIVRTARRRHHQGETQTALAAEYGVSVPSMHEAIKGKQWRWVA
jgi:hypothetical protein